MEDVSPSAVKAAVKRRREDILQNLETMTLKKLRQQLEKDMGLPVDALKPHKDLLSRLIDKVIASAAKVTPAAAGAEAEAAAEEDEPSDGAEEESSGVEKKRKRKAAPAAKGEKGKRQPKSKERKAKEPAAEVAKPAGPRQYGKRVVKLRNLCKEATISIPPALYIKNKTDAQLEAALEALLEKHGLTADAGKDEVAKVKRKLALQRDMDGIDTSNIILEGGRRSRHAAAAPVNYRQLAEPDSEEEEEASGSESDSESAGFDAKSGEEEGGSAGKDKKRGTAGKGGAAKKPRQAKAAASSDEEEASGSGEEEEYQEEGSEDEEQQQQWAPAKPSPDENKATANLQRQPAATMAKRAVQPSPAPKKAAAASDSDDDVPQPAKKPRQVLGDWSDDE